MLVSVIIPSYNYKKYLVEAVNSVLSQTFNDYEIIIVDDGSKPEVYQFVEEVVAQNSRIQLFTHPGRQNKGLAATLQVGIKECNGDWIAILEADDLWSQDCLKKRVQSISEDTSIVVNNIEPLLSAGVSDKWFTSYVPRVMSQMKSRQRKSSFFQVMDLMMWENIFPTFSAVMFRKELAEKINWASPVRGWTDWFVWAQMCQDAKVSFCPDKLTRWRLHDDSQNSKKAGLKTYLQEYSSFRKALYDELKKNGQHDSRIALLRLPSLIPLGRRAFLSVKQIGIKNFLESVFQRLKH